MSEPYVPVPDPGSMTHWDPSPARCPQCRAIIAAHPASRHDGRWEGWCPEHGQVVATYSTAAAHRRKEDDDESSETDS